MGVMRKWKGFCMGGKYGGGLGGGRVKEMYMKFDMGGMEMI